MSLVWILRARLIAFFFGFSMRVIAIASFGKVGGKITTRFEEETEAIEFGGLVMVKMNGMVFCLAVMIFIIGRDRKSGIILSFPLTCENIK